MHSKPGSPQPCHGVVFIPEQSGYERLSLRGYSSVKACWNAVYCAYAPSALSGATTERHRASFMLAKHCLTQGNHKLLSDPNLLVWPKAVSKSHAASGVLCLMYSNSSSSAWPMTCLWPLSKDTVALLTSSSTKCMV